LGKYPWEVTAWEITFGKVPNIIGPVVVGNLLKTIDFTDPGGGVFFASLFDQLVKNSEPYR